MAHQRLQGDDVVAAFAAEEPVGETVRPLRLRKIRDQLLPGDVGDDRDMGAGCAEGLAAG